jgi:hypothetical protein
MHPRTHAHTGKIAYHITSTQAAVTAQRGNHEECERLRRVLRVVLQALAEKLQAWRDSLSAQAWQDTVWRIQRRVLAARHVDSKQRRGGGEGPAAALATLPPPDAAAATGGSQAVSADVRWLLQHYAVFHADWSPSTRKPNRTPSPTYDGALLDEAVRELWEFTPCQQSE